MSELYQTKYVGVAGKSYISFKVPTTEEFNEYQIEMLTKNSIDSLLSLIVRRINNDYVFSYEITSKISLAKLLERKSLSSDEFEYVIKQIGQLSSKLEDFLLDDSSILYEKNYIYCDPASLSLYFIYLPAQNNISDLNNMREFLQKLIVEDIQLQDDSSGNLLKRLLDTLKTDTFTPEQFLSCVNEQSIKEQITYTNPPEYEIKQDIKEKNYMTQKDYTKQKGYNEQESDLNGYYTALEHGQTPIMQRDFSERKNTASGQQSESIPINLKLNYPLKSFLIAGLINIILIGILIYTFFTITNSSSLLTTILGLVLISFAINYFLLTRLFSEEKRITIIKDDMEYNKTNKYVNNKVNSNLGKRFVNDELYNNIGNGFLNNKVNSSGGNGFVNHTVDSKIEKRFVNHKVNSSIEKRFSNEKPNGFASKRSEHNDMEEDIILPKFNNFNNSMWLQSHVVKEMQIDDRIQNVNNIDSANSTNSTDITDKYENTQEVKSNIKTSTYNDKSISDKTMILGSSVGNQAYLQSHSCPTEKIIISKPSLLLGRLSDSVDYTIQNNAVGKIHSEIIKKEDNYFIIDLNSVNGTYINNERIVCNTETELKNGDIVTLANESYTFVG